MEDNKKPIVPAKAIIATNTLKRKLVEDYGDDSESDFSDDESIPKKPLLEEKIIDAQPSSLPAEDPIQKSEILNPSTNSLDANQVLTLDVSNSNNIPEVVETKASNETVGIKTISTNILEATNISSVALPEDVNDTEVKEKSNSLINTEAIGSTSLPIADKIVQKFGNELFSTTPKDVVEIVSEDKEDSVKPEDYFMSSDDTLPGNTGITVPEPFSSTKDEEVFLQISDNAQCAPSKDKNVLELPTLSESLKKAVSSDASMNLDAKELVDTKKEEIFPMEVDTPIGSSVNTPCESGETSPSTTSTPVDSCQASAAPSPLLKEDVASVDCGIDDESSKDTNENGEEKGKGNKVIGARLLRGRAKKAAVKAKRVQAAKISAAKQREKAALLLDEETRMSATNENKSVIDDEDSQSSVSTTSKKKIRTFRSEIIIPDSTEIFTASKIIEYMWPLENGEHYFIQEHVAQYLGVTSFKRKYKDVRRRPIESQEKEYLKDLGLVTEMACDLGLTAVRSEDTLDILFNDFPSKYEELQKIMRERKEHLLKEKGKVEYQVANLDKSKMDEYSRKAALSASKWNAAFNRERREERRYAFDLDTFTLHVPLNKYYKRSPEMTKISSYPVAVLPGQYTDYYKQYSFKELKCLPLQTVIHGPFTAEELAAESQIADSDEDSAANSEGTGLDVKDVSLFEPESSVQAPLDPMAPEKQYRCKGCNGGRDRNKNGQPEPLIICGTCRSASHPTCIDLPLGMINKIESYSWQCMDCKTCVQCNDPDDEEKMIFCDMCDRGFHIYCVGLRKVPNGRWHCKNCAECSSCGARTASGIDQHIKNAEWQHEFKKEKKDSKTLKYACTLCVPCDKYWKRRQYCAVCLKVYRSIPEDGMVRCTGCPKYVHKDGCSVLFDNERYCNVCYKSRNKTALNHSRILAAAKKKMLSSY